MTNYVIGSDNIDRKEQSYIDTIARILEEAGNTCEKRPVGPGYVQGYGLSNNSSGKTAVFIVGGNDGGTYQDFVQGISRGYYHYDLCWFAFASWTAHSWITPEDLKNRPMVRAHDDNFSKDVSGFVGKTAAQYFSENSQYIKMAYGNSPEELAKMILNGGEDNKDDGGSASTIKEALKELLSAWDGDVECWVEGDTCHVRKIKNPNESYELELIEGVNLTTDSLTIHDYYPETINSLTVTWQGGDPIILKNDKLIARFGEKTEEVEATKKIQVTTTEVVNDTDADIATDTDTGADTTDTDTTTEPETKTTTKTEEVPVETYEEALDFAYNHWHKIMRDNGHSIECKIVGSSEWRQGKWVRVYIPSYNEDIMMYTSKVAHSNDGDSVWTTNLTLVDYPPSLGEPKESEEETEEETDEEIEDTEIAEEGIE